MGGSTAESLRWLVRAVGGKPARETAKRVIKEKQRGGKTDQPAK